MNELPCVQPFMLSLPSCRCSLHTPADMPYACEHCVCTSSRGGLNGFPTWSIVSRSLPLPSPHTRSSFPFTVVRCLWHRDVSSLYHVRRTEREIARYVKVHLYSSFDPQTGFINSFTTVNRCKHLYFNPSTAESIVNLGQS